MKFILVHFIIMLAICSLASAQISGRVIDYLNNEALEGVEVRWKDAKTISGASGRFLLEASGWASSDTVWFRRQGYKPQLVLLNATTSGLLVGLYPDERYINEVHISALQADTRLLRVPGAVSLITPQALRRDNDTQLTPSLNRVPGVFMHAGTFSTSRITMRGIGSRSLFSTNKVRAYFNDIPLTTGDGETTLEDIDLQLIERIELIKGPSSSVYGAGLGGTIVLQARKAAFGPVRWQSGIGVGSFGLFRHQAMFSAGSDKANLLLSYNHQSADGFRENSAYYRDVLALNGTFYAGPNTQVAILAYYNKVKGYIPSSIDSISYRTRPQAAAPAWLQLRGYEDYTRTRLGVSIQHEFNDKIELAGSIFTTSRYADEPRPFNFLRESSQSTGARLRLAYQPVPALKLQVGTEVFTEWYHWRTYRNAAGRQGSILSDNEEDRFYYNLFAQAQVEFSPKWELTAGLNLNQTRYSLLDLSRLNGVDLSGTRNFSPILSPRLATSYALRQEVALYASVSHGFSPPMLEETLTPSGQINPNIRPESGMSYEVGSRGSALNGRLTYDAGVHWMDIRNLLVARRTSEDAFIGLNAGRTSHKGLELSASYQLFDASVAWSVKPFMSYTHSAYRFVDFEDADHNFNGNRLTGVAPHVLNLGIDAELKAGLYAHAHWQWVDAMPMTDDNTRFSDAYGIAGITAGYRQLIAKRVEFNLQGGVANLFNTAYASMILVNAIGAQPRFYYPGMPRNYFANLQVAYRFGKLNQI